jgi:hypothetical protein
VIFLYFLLYCCLYISTLYIRILNCGQIRQYQAYISVSVFIRPYRITVFSINLSVRQFRTICIISTVNLYWLWVHKPFNVSTLYQLSTCIGCGFTSHSTFQLYINQYQLSTCEDNFVFLHSLWNLILGIGFLASIEPPFHGGWLSWNMVQTVNSPLNVIRNNSVAKGVRCTPSCEGKVSLV